MINRSRFRKIIAGDAVRVGIVGLNVGLVKVEVATSCNGIEVGVGVDVGICSLELDVRSSSHCVVRRLSRGCCCPPAFSSRNMSM